MMRRPILLVGILALLVSLATGQEQATENVFESAEHGFRLELPAGWTPMRESETETRFTVGFVPPDEGGLVQLTLRVLPRGSAESPEALRTRTVESLEGQDQYTNPREEVRTLGEREAPALVLDVRMDGLDLRLEQIYLEGNGLLFSLQGYAPAERYESLTDEWAAIWSTLIFTELPPEQLEQRRLEELAARCGCELNWAKTWEEAAERAREEGRLILVHARLYRGFALTDEVMSRVFMAPHIRDLINERYVPFQLDHGLAVPFADHDVYGLSGSTFGAAALIVTPGAQVVSEVEYPTFEFLVAGLEHAPKPQALSTKGPTLERAAAHLRQGEVERAEQLLVSPASAQEFLLRSRLHTWRRQGEAALVDLRFAREMPGAGQLGVDLDLQEAIVLTGMGRSLDAAQILTDLLEESPDHPRANEATFLLGELRCSLTVRAAGEGLLRELAEDHPEDRWAWRAAATLTSTSYQQYGVGSLAWGEEAEYELLLPIRPQPLTADEWERGELEAIAYLLAHQTPEGAWLGGTELHEEADEPPHDFQLAATAICASGLLPHRERADVAKAVDQATDWILAGYANQLDTEVPTSFMDYAVWSRAYVLGHLADRVEFGLSEVAEYEDVVALLLEDLTVRQKPGGGWSYYLTMDLSAASDPGNEAMSFTTAAIVHSLLQAREVGFVVPDELIACGLDCLEGLRVADGVYRYMGDPTAGGGTEGRAGAAGRGAICAHALLRGGRGSVDELRVALDLFLEHRGGLMKEAAKMLMHTGPQAQGSHYVHFDFATIADALDAVPAEERVRVRDALLEDILSMHCENGSNQASPIISAATSTGLALLAFRHLRED